MYPFLRTSSWYGAWLCVNIHLLLLLLQNEADSLSNPQEFFDFRRYLRSREERPPWRCDFVVTIVFQFIPLRYIILKFTYVLPLTATNLLVSSIHATCFGSTNLSQAFKYMVLKLKIQCIHILNLWDLTNCTSLNNLHVAIKI
jgi:ABC-type transport system involved in Fe-S cluster assembly, permease and ATPase components